MRERKIMDTDDERLTTGADATLENVGPSRTMELDDLDSEVIEGTSSGMGLRGKPERGKPGRGGA